MSSQFKKIKRRWEEYDLAPDKNFVELDIEKKYKPGIASIIFFSWTNINLEPMPSKTPRMHYQMIDFLLEEGNRKQAVVFRGGAKTVLISKNLPLMCADVGLLFVKLNNKYHFKIVRFFLICSATDMQAKNLLKDMKSELQGSEELSRKIKVFPGNEHIAKVNNKNEVCLYNERGERIYILAVSVGRSMRGEKREGTRPQVVSVDDILRDDALTKALEREKTLMWMVSVILPALDGTWNKLISVGTPMTPDDVIAKLAEGTSFDSIKIRIAKYLNKKKMLSAWPSLHKVKDIKDRYNEAKDLGMVNSFYREYMLELRKKGKTMFDMDKIKTYDPRTINVAELEIYTSIDMAISMEKESDRSSIITVGVNSKRQMFMLEIDGGIMTPRDIINKIKERRKRWGEHDFKAEKASLQLVLNFFFEEEQINGDAEEYVYIEELIQNSTIPKVRRIESLTFIINSKSFFVPEVLSQKEQKIMMKFQENEIVYGMPPPVNEIELLEWKDQVEGMTMAGWTTESIDHLDCTANFVEKDWIYYPEDVWERIESMERKRNKEIRKFFKNEEEKNKKRKIKKRKLWEQK